MKVSLNTAVFLDHLNEGESQLDCLKNLPIPADDIDNIQVRGEFFKKENKDQELEGIKKICQENNWGLYYSVPEEFFKDGRINQSFADNLEMAKEHHLKFLKYFVGDVSGVNLDDIAHVSNQLTEAGVQLTLENLSNATGKLEVVEKALSAIKMFKNIGFTFDAGNWYWVDENPTTAFATLKDEITNYHLKDIKNKETVMLGEGSTDWKPMVTALSNDIPIFLEYAISDKQMKHEVDLVNDVIAKR